MRSQQARPYNLLMKLTMVIIGAAIRFVIVTKPEPFATKTLFKTLYMLSLEHPILYWLA